MTTNAVWLEIDGTCVAPALRAALKKVDSTEGEMILDFSSVHRVDPAALRVMEELAGAADNNAVKVVLRGVTFGIYKALKLAKLAPRFSFLN